MRYYYDLEKKPTDLPIDEDRGLIYFRLVQCPFCEEKRTSPVHISTMNPAKAGSREFRRSWNALKRNQSNEELDRWPLYLAFATQFQRDFPGLFISPGIRFGILRVHVDRMVSLAAPGMGKIVLVNSLFEHLRKKGIDVDGWPVNARFSKKIRKPEELLELVAMPVASAAPNQGINFCSACNRSDYNGWQGLDFHPCPVDALSIPAGCNAFRIIECPTNIIVSERFVNEVQGFDCGNVKWAELKTE
jgi:hypothetical protein